MATQRLKRSEKSELVSQVMALRMDYVQQILRAAGIPYSGLRKPQLRQQVLGGLDAGALTAEGIVQQLSLLEPGGKQHVFVLRAPTALNNDWKQPAQIRRRLRQITAASSVLGQQVPLIMPEALTLSSIGVADGSVQISAVEARSYLERAERLDSRTTDSDGRTVHMRAWVEHVARSTVRLQWHTSTRHAALHITQATGQVGIDHYGEVWGRFESLISPFLELGAFRRANLYKVLNELRKKEQSAQPWTRSRRGAWDLPSGAEMTATSSSADASIYDDATLGTAISGVATAQTSRSGNLRWLPDASGALSEPLHINIIASDSRVHFMVPSTPQSVEHVLSQIRKLL